MQKAQHESSSSPSSASPGSGPDSPASPGPGSPDSTDRQHEPVTDEPLRADTNATGHREYDRSGLYPSGGGKAFRIWALLGWLAAVIVVLAGVSALLNILLLD